jgi:hypothetical protein
MDRLTDSQLVVSREMSGLRTGSRDAMTAPGSPSVANGPGVPDALPTADDVPATDARHLYGPGDTLPGPAWNEPGQDAGGWRVV